MPVIVFLHSASASDSRGGLRPQAVLTGIETPQRNISCGAGCAILSVGGADAPTALEEFLACR
jgi:hypothetical protein